MTVVEAPASSHAGRWDRFWFTPVPAARLEVFRRVVAAYVLLDVVFVTSFVRDHGSVDAALYQPLLIGRLLPLPVPTDLVVTGSMVVVIASSVAMVSGRANRAVGAVAAIAYLEWMVIAFSYGKVDHDRVPLVLALFVLASVRRTSLVDRSASVEAGWALRMVQVAAVSTYFLSAVAKVRYGGWLWANSATLTQALVRRGTSFGRAALDVPVVLVAAQWCAVVFEVMSPLMLRRGRTGAIVVALALVFHVVTWSMLTIGFYPQVVCLLAFAPLERLSRAHPPGAGPRP